MARAREATKAKGGDAEGAAARGIEWPTLSPVAFQGQFDHWLKQNEAAKPFAKLRELEGRIEAGEKKIGLAVRNGKVMAEDPSYAAAVEKLKGLMAERDELRRTAQVPHFALATVHNFLRASRGWGLAANSSIRIKIPGSIDITVDLSEAEIPF